jgi:hypothetical protein
VPTRRRFLAATGQAALGAWAIASNAYALAAPLARLDLDVPRQRTLTRIARLIYPHDGLPDSVYAAVVGDLIDDSQDASTLRAGLESLSGFLELDEAQQIAVLKSIENGPFFAAVKTPLMWGLYNRPELRALINYPGPSLPFGGYIRRGFDDIDWLPE